MASKTVISRSTTAYVSNGFSYTFTCAATYVNFGGPITDYPEPEKASFSSFAILGGPTSDYSSLPTSCQDKPLYSSLAIDGTPLFPCTDPLAYKACLPSPSYAFEWSVGTDADCDQTYTFYAPETACPTGWEVGTQFAITKIKEKEGTSAVRTPDMERVVPEEMYPTVLGVHKLCCPYSYHLTGGRSYGCASTATTTRPALQNTTLCGTSCHADANATTCHTTTTTLFAPTAPMTYAVEALYLIGNATQSASPSGPGYGYLDPAHGKNVRDLALPVGFVVLAILILMALALRPFRRHRRARKRRVADIALPELERRGRGARSGGPGETGDVSVSVATEQSAPDYDDSDPPPPYTSEDVWAGDGRAGAAR